MDTKTPIFFCAVGGSGMLPLALIVKSLGHAVSGSDRGHDQSRTPERFAFIAAQGIRLFPQDGSGVTDSISRVVVSAAVEAEVPDYQAALRQNIPVVTRATLLAELFNKATTRVAVAGTSGKSTVTGMVGLILAEAGLNPTIVNGAVMKNFVTAEIPFASALVGDPHLFVAEVDESDGSIAQFTPDIAILNNIAIDHKSMDELRQLFGDFIGKARYPILNLDNAEVALLADKLPNAITYSLDNPAATLSVSDIEFHPASTAFIVRHNNGETAAVKFPLLGHHNISNALAAIGAALALGVDLQVAARTVSCFTGIRRRMDMIGTAKGVTVIDDFAHNPDKIGASLRALHQFPGRLLVLFQPHGYGPLRLMRQEFAACFAEALAAGDRLYMPDPLYFGGTVNRAVGSRDLVDDIRTKGADAAYHATRENCAAAIIAAAQPGDRIVVMGARDDTLPAFAEGILDRIAKA